MYEDHRSHERHSLDLLDHLDQDPTPETHLAPTSLHRVVKLCREATQLKCCPPTLPRASKSDANNIADNNRSRYPSSQRHFLPTHDDTQPHIKHIDEACHSIRV